MYLYCLCRISPFINVLPVNQALNYYLCRLRCCLAELLPFLLGSNSAYDPNPSHMSFGI